MKMADVIKLAKRWDIPFNFGCTKENLIRAIQIKEGYQPCFRRQRMCDEKFAADLKLQSRRQEPGETLAEAGKPCHTANREETS